MSIRIEQLSGLAYNVNGKLVAMTEQGKYEPVNSNETITFKEREALNDFIRCNKGKIKVRSTVK